MSVWCLSRLSGRNLLYLGRVCLHSQGPISVSDSSLYTSTILSSYLQPDVLIVLWFAGMFILPLVSLVSIRWWRPSIVSVCWQKSIYISDMLPYKTSGCVLYLCASLRILTTICTASGFVVNPSHLPLIFQSTPILPLLLSALLPNNILWILWPLVGSTVHRTLERQLATVKIYVIYTNLLRSRPKKKGL